MEMRKLILAILLLLPSIVYGQSNIVFGGVGTQNDDTSLSYNTVRLLKYAQSDTNKVFSVNSRGFLELRTKGTGGGADSTVFATQYRVDTAKTAIRAQIAGISGSPGGSNTQVQFNNSSAFGGDAGFTYNLTTNEITSDTLEIKQVNVTSVDKKYALDLTVTKNEYAGIRINNLATSGTPASEIFLGDGPNFPNRGLALRQLTDEYTGVESFSIIASSALNGLIFEQEEYAPYFFEFGVPGINVKFAAYAYYDTATSAHWHFGDNGDGSLADHGATVYVAGNTKVKGQLELCDAGNYYSRIVAKNYLDGASYVEGVGFEFWGITVAGPAVVARIDSTGRLKIPFYTGGLNEGYTTKALYGTGGNIEQGEIFDAAGGTRNDGQVMFWSSGLPTSNTGLQFNTTTGLIATTTDIVAGGNMRIGAGTLAINDEGHEYAWIKAKNYQNSGSYIEDVGFKFFTIISGNPELLSFAISGAGIVHIPNTPTYADNATAVAAIGTGKLYYRTGHGLDITF